MMRICSAMLVVCISLCVAAAQDTAPAKSPVTSDQKISPTNAPLASQPCFEAADVHVSGPDAPPFTQFGRLIGERFTMSSATLPQMISLAYGYKSRFVYGTKLERLLRPQDCHFFPSNSIHSGPDVSQAEAAKQTAELDKGASGIDGDALLFLGSASSLTRSPQSGDVYLDSAFRKEIERRLLIEFGRPLNPSIPPASPQFLHKTASE